MGTMNPPDKCFITNLPTTDVNHLTDGSGLWDGVEYYIQLNNKNIILRFQWTHVNSPLVDKNKHVFKNLLLNGKFPEDYYLKSAAGFLIGTDRLHKTGILDNEILEGILKENQNS